MVFVTGGTGFLGSHLLRVLVRSGQPVRALFRSAIPAQLQDIQQQVEWVQGDVLDVCALEDALKGVTQVYHCAAVVSFQPSRRRQMMQVNVEGTANVVNACLDAGVKKLVHVSSVAAIGRAKANGLITEEGEWEESNNNSQYAVSKYHSEMEVNRGIAEGLPAVTVNPSIILGSGFWNDGSGMLVKNAWKEFPYYTQGINGFVDVLDVVKAMTALMQSNISGERFILSADNWSYYDLFREMAQQLQRKPPHIAVKPWLAEIVWRLEKLKSRLTGSNPLVTRETARTAQLKVYYSNDKILEALPGFAFTPLTQTIERICRSFLAEKNHAARPAGN